MKKSKKLYIKKEQWIHKGKKTFKKGRLRLGSGQKTQKGRFLPLLLWLASLGPNLLGNMGGKGIKPPSL